jgi:hypothetical protein
MSYLRSRYYFNRCLARPKEAKRTVTQSVMRQRHERVPLEYKSGGNFFKASRVRGPDKTV